MSDLTTYTSNFESDMTSDIENFGENAVWYIRDAAYAHGELEGSTAAADLLNSEYSRADWESAATPYWIVEQAYADAAVLVTEATGVSIPDYGHKYAEGYHIAFNRVMRDAGRRKPHAAKAA